MLSLLISRCAPDLHTPTDLNIPSQASVLEATEAFMKLGKQVAALEQKRDAEQSEVNKLQDAMQLCDEELAVCATFGLLDSSHLLTISKTWTEKAEEISPRIEQPRTIRVIETKLQSLINTLAQHQKEYVSFARCCE